ncbi:MAG: hypothetical protein WBG37_19005 [Desulfobacterales bacterium]
MLHPGLKPAALKVQKIGVPDFIVSGLMFLSFLGFWAALVLVPLTAQGATIVLKNGTQLKTPKLWVDNAQVHFMLDGLPAVIAPNDIAKLIDVPASVTLALVKNSPNPKPQRPDTINPAPKPVKSQPPRPAAAPSAPPNKAPADKDGAQGIGFQELSWDTPLAELPGLELFDEDPSFGGIQCYRRPTAELSFGPVPLADAVYGFWQGRFYTLSLLVDGRERFDTLKVEAFQRFGPGLQTDETRQVYIWYGGATDRMLEFDPLNQLGLLWMRSAELNGEVTRSAALNTSEMVLP